VAAYAADRLANLNERAYEDGDLLGPLITVLGLVENSDMSTATIVLCACCEENPAVFAIGSTPVCEACADEL